MYGVQKHTTSYTRHQTYWLNRFQTVTPVLQLPMDKKHSSVQTFAGDQVNTFVHPELMKKLQQLAEKTESSMCVDLFFEN
ncbi:condensation domain-containing protein [Lysinibacillus sphaericus]